jgi:hypothetical protein
MWGWLLQDTVSPLGDMVHLFIDLLLIPVSIIINFFDMFFVPVSQQVWHVDPSLLKGPECRA